MATPAGPSDDKTNPLQFLPSKNQEEALLTFANSAQQLLINQFSLRSHMEEIDRYYMREQNWTQAQLKARIANKTGDAHKMQDPTVPIVMPQVISALCYMANVFLTGYPIFGVSADPSTEDAALMMETIIAENAITAKWALEMQMFFNDGLKYNLHGLEIEWGQKTVYNVENDLASKGGVKAKKTLWNGNYMRRMDLYNTFFDPRVHPWEIAEIGEFAGYIKIMSRVMMKQFFNQQFGKIPPATVVRALESSPAATSATSSMAPFGYYQPIINPFPIMDRNNLMGFNWLNWAQNLDGRENTIKYNNVYTVTKMYARIIPSDFDMKVPEPNTPQVWKFIIVNGAVVVIMERMPNVHNFIPIFFGQPLIDGLDYQTKSFATNVCDMQDIASAMLAGFMASKRKLIGDRMMYDPSRVKEKDINSRNPAAKIPVRPSAYGKPVSDAVFPIPYRDEQTRSLVDGAQLMINWADKINGQNAATQGQFTKGNRTLHEYEDIMGHGNDHNQLMAMGIEQQVFIPVKEVIKLNILQFQPEEVLFNREKNQQVNVKPEELRKAAVHFKVSDGEIPAEKLMGTDEFQTVMQVVGQSPQLASGYNLPGLFSYFMKVQTGMDLSPFEKSPLQLQFEQMQAQWQQVAEAAIKAGQQPPQQPQMPPQLVQELQMKQATGGSNPSMTTPALESTQG